MRDVTIAITTTGRPDFLRTALQSVRNQQAKDRIALVVVSENKDDRRSEQVVREFPDLPIRYLHRSPTLPMLEHVFSTLGEAQTPYTAILNDDDWWASGHLGEATAVLDREPAHVAYAAASVYVADETDISPMWIYRSPAVWLMTGRRSWLQPWTIDASTMLTLGWVLTPFHWSTMVCRTAALREVMHVLARESYHTHTIDRLLYLHLSLRGSISYNPVSDTFARWHAGNWVKDKKQQEILAVIRSTAAISVHLAEERGLNVYARWREALAQMPPEFEGHLLQHFRESHTQDELEAHGLARFFRGRLPSARTAAVQRTLIQVKSLIRGQRIQLNA